MAAEEVQGLGKSTLKELERILSTKAVVGEPITIDGNIIVPPIAFGFGFGARGE